MTLLDLIRQLNDAILKDGNMNREVQIKIDKDSYELKTVTTDHPNTITLSSNE